jgi:phosphatidylinositol alpha-mannosyltransferase
MKIGFVLDDSLDKTDGVQQYVLTLGQWMRHQGHEIHYLVGHTERKDIPHIHSLSHNIQTHFNQNRMSTPLPASKKLIKQLLEQEQFDALHVQMPYSPFMAGRVIKAASKTTKVVGTFHIIPFSWIEKTATRLLGLILWRTVRRFNTIYSVSKPAQVFARRSFGVKSTVLPNVVNVAAFHTGKPIKKYDDGKVNIVFLGRLVERKGCMYLLQALEQLHQKHLLMNVRVLICGKGQLSSDLERYVKDHHLSSVVTFVGFVSEEDKPHYLATADIAVFPSTGGESFGIVLIEAMAAGSSVVLGGNNVGYTSVLSERPELLIDPLDTAEFAKILKHFIASKRARQSAAKWQSEHVQQYDVAVVGRKLLEQYDR